MSATGAATAVALPFTVVLISKAVSLVAAGCLLAIGFQIGHGICRTVQSSLESRTFAKRERQHKEPEDVTRPNTTG